MNRVRVIKKESSPAKDSEKIAYLLLKEATRKKFKAIREEILASLDGCGITVEEMMSFSANVMREALNDYLGEA